MSRDDSVLNTGMSSALERRIKRDEQIRQQDRQYTRGKLTPGAEIIKEWLLKERAAMTDISKAVTDFDPEFLQKSTPLARKLAVTDKELLQAFTLARLMNVEFIDTLLARVNNVLRKVPEETKETEDSDAA